MVSATGAATRAVYRWEDSFAGGSSDANPKTMGHDVTVTSAELSNNPVDLFDPGSREAAERIGQTFEGTWGVEFTLANPWFWRAVIAEASTSGTGPYTHTFDGEVPSSMQLTLPVEATGNERELLGCVASSCTLDVSDGGDVTVSIEGAYADETETTNATLDAQTTESYDALMFADGSLTFDGVTYSLVQNVSVTIENNIDLVPELGSRFAADYSPKARSTTVDWEKIVEGDSLLLDSYGGSASSPADRVDAGDEVSGSLTFDNGKTGSAQNQQTISFTGTLPDTYDRSGTGDPTADYLESLSYGALSVSAEAVNADSTAL